MRAIELILTTTNYRDAVVMTLKKIACFNAVVKAGFSSASIKR